MKHVPLSDTFTLVCLFGLMICSFLLLNGTLALSWGFTLVLAFLVGLIASFISISPTRD